MKREGYTAKIITHPAWPKPIHIHRDHLQTSKRPILPKPFHQILSLNPGRSMGIIPEQGTIRKLSIPRSRGDQRTNPASTDEGRARAPAKGSPAVKMTDHENELDVDGF